MPVQRRKRGDGASDDEGENYLAESAEDDVESEDEFVAESGEDVAAEAEDDVEPEDSHNESASNIPKRTPKKKARTAAAAASSSTKPKKPHAGSAKRASRLERLWAGPSDSDRCINPCRIDVGLDRATWAALRNMQVNRASFEIETDEDVLALAIPTTGKVHLAMLSSAGEPLASRDASPMKLGPLDVHELIGETKGWVANTGLSVCSVDWAPARSGMTQDGSEFCADYVAVSGVCPPAGNTCSLATYAIEQRATERVKDGKPGVVQIWRVDAAIKSAEGRCRPAMILTHTFGRCIMVKWCPISLSAEAETEAPPPESNALPIIGYLAAVFCDGYLRVCAIPDPGAIRSGKSSDSGPVCVRWPKYSLVEINSPRGIFTSLAWASSDLLVAGTSSGRVTAWLLGSSIRAQHTSWMESKKGDKGPWPYLLPAEFLEGEICQLAPVVNFTIHSGVVCSVDSYCGGSESFGNDDDEELFTQVSMSNIQIISASDNGRVQQTLAAFPTRHHRTLAIIPSKSRSTAVFWPTRSCLYADADNCVRLTTVPALTNPGDPWVFAGFSKDGDAEAPTAWNSISDMPAVYAMCPEGAVLDISTSAFHPYIAVSSSDGTVMIQNGLNFTNTTTLTTKRFSSAMDNASVNVQQQQLPIQASSPSPQPSQLLRFRHSCENCR
ncbi:hypothetical protein GGI21_002028 [Coemansia aciculifera]|nr:hypothetical protein GGI21_002028 [Coemansia aciculifera]